MEEKKKILISLHKGYGLGDAVQMSAVLRHVVKHRPNWDFDFLAEEGRHCVGRGLATRTFAYGHRHETPHYDAEVQICLYDTWANFHDRPNTRVSSCLFERFGMDWDPECARYLVRVDPASARAAKTILYGWRGVKSGSRDTGKYVDAGLKLVAVHYQGDSSPGRKNLTHDQADRVCQAITKLGAEPVILDWRDQCRLHYRRLTTPMEWGRDAEMVCAVIAQCAAFVGIDSGPSKCASATDTPALVVWTGHHPAPFHDPAPNTTHLVPVGYHGLEPVCGDPGVIQWFEANHSVRQYNGDPVGEVAAWLGEVLR